MATTIDRSAIGTNDDGSGTVGTVVNTGYVGSAIYDKVDALFYGSAALYLGGALGLGTYTTTSVGTQNNWDIDTAFGKTVGILRCNNATALTITGIKAPSDGRLLLIESVGAGTVTLNHQDAGSTAANRLIASTATAFTVATSALLAYDGTTASWRVLPLGSPVKASSESTFSAKAITSNGVAVMVGCAGAITPVVTGKFLVTVSGYLVAPNAIVAVYQIYTGTGVAPANGAAMTGTFRGSPGASYGNGQDQAFSISALVSGTAGTTYWIDLGGDTAGAGTVTFYGTIDAIEVG